jgi:hypothetical protein
MGTKARIIYILRKFFLLRLYWNLNETFVMIGIKVPIIYILRTVRLDKRLFKKQFKKYWMFNIWLSDYFMINKILKDHQIWLRNILYNYLWIYLYSIDFNKIANSFM